MRLVLRIGAVILATAVWIVGSSAFLFWLGVGEARFPAETTFSNALADAQTEAMRQRPGIPAPSVCGFPAVGSGSFELSHGEVVLVARCLQRSGHLGADDLSSIETASFGISGGCAGQGDTGAILDQTACTYAYTKTDARGAAWIPFAITLAGLPLVVWLVGFVLPWPRRRRS